MKLLEDIEITRESLIGLLSDIGFVSSEPDMCPDTGVAQMGDVMVYSREDKKDIEVWIGDGEDCRVVFYDKDTENMVSLLRVSQVISLELNSDRTISLVYQNNNGSIDEEVYLCGTVLNAYYSGII